MHPEFGIRRPLCSMHEGSPCRPSLWPGTHPPPQGTTGRSYIMDQRIPSGFLSPVVHAPYRTFDHQNHSQRFSHSNSMARMMHCMFSRT
jgi:hypothetical protein